MTEKEIIEKLLAHYEYAIKEVEKAEYYEDVSDELFVDMGLCHCADANYSIDISTMLFIKNAESKNKYGGYIYRNAYESNNKGAHLECIQYRIDFLKNALKEA